MKTICLSRPDFEKLCIENNWRESIPENIRIISIGETSECSDYYNRYEPHFLDSSEKVLNVDFDDIPSETFEYSGIVFKGITPELSERIVKFIRDSQDCDFYIHCRAGKSRSQAVTRFILDTFPETHPEYEINHSNPPMTPNMFVLASLKKAYRIQCYGTETVLFLGSFNPPHLGHSLVIQNCQDAGYYVGIIPAKSNPWKSGQLPLETRIEMLECLYRDNLGVFISDIEKGLSGYTYDTLKEFKALFGPEFLIATTPETLSEIPGWHRGEEILQEYSFLVIRYEHFKDYQIPAGVKAKYLDSKDDINICSTKIREALKEGLDTSGMLDPRVLQYIKTHHLYE